MQETYEISSLCRIAPIMSPIHIRVTGHPLVFVTGTFKLLNGWFRNDWKGQRPIWSCVGCHNTRLSLAPPWAAPRPLPGELERRDPVCVMSGVRRGCVQPTLVKRKHACGESSARAGSTAVRGLLFCRQHMRATWLDSAWAPGRAGRMIQLAHFLASNQSELPSSVTSEP